MSEKASRPSKEREHVTFVPVVVDNSELIISKGKFVGTLTRDIRDGNRIIVWESGEPELTTTMDFLREIVKRGDALDALAKPEEPETENNLPQ